MSEDIKVINLDEEVMSSGIAEDNFDDGSILGPGDIALDFSEQGMLADTASLDVEKYRKLIDPPASENTTQKKTAQQNLLGDVVVKTDADIVQKKFSDLIETYYKVKVYILNRPDDLAEYSEILTQAENDKMKLIDVSLGARTNEYGPFAEIVEEQTNFSQRYGSYSVFLKIKYTTIKKLENASNDMADFMIEESENDK